MASPASRASRVPNILRRIEIFQGLQGWSRIIRPGVPIIGQSYCFLLNLISSLNGARSVDCHIHKLYKYKKVAVFRGTTRHVHVHIYVHLLYGELCV